MIIWYKNISAMKYEQMVVTQWKKQQKHLTTTIIWMSSCSFIIHSTTVEPFHNVIAIVKVIFMLCNLNIHIILCRSFFRC